MEDLTADTQDDVPLAHPAVLSTPILIQRWVLSLVQELEAGVVKVKDLAANTQDDVPLAQLADDLKRRIASRGEFSLIAAGAAGAAAQAAAAP